MDAEGGVYLMHAANEGYYKLPGGGVEAGESMETALHREMREETGFTVQVVAPVGRVVQYHQTESFLQDSHAYVVRVAGQPETPLLTDEEAAAGFRVVRFPDMEAAITALEELRHNADWHSMLNRELVILRAAQQLEVVA
jgi:8-oxo-dGTP diphosphatase